MAEGSGLIIDWVNMPTYNTIMSVATGAALCSLASIGKNLMYKNEISPKGWALNLGFLGIILFATGLHMTLTWPLSKYFPFDNIVFGEPSLAFGGLLLAFAFYFWKESETISNTPNPLINLGLIGKQFKFFFYGIGLGLIGIGIAGVHYELFAAPPEEPISGEFADYPIIEAIFISSLWALVGVISIVMPSVFTYFSKGNAMVNFRLKFTYYLMYILGLIFLLFGALNYFTHIGLIVNTMPG